MAVQSGEAVPPVFEVGVGAPRLFGAIILVAALAGCTRVDADERINPFCPPMRLSGSAVDRVSAIVSEMEQNAGAGSNAFDVPSTSSRAQFAQAVIASLAGNESASCQLPASYRVIQLTDPTAGEVRLVAELSGDGTPNPVHRWGTYAALASPAAAPYRALVVEAPHPLFDVNTWREATDLFVQARAQWLLIAGAHRCANDLISPCTGTTTACGTLGPFRVSDTAHSIASPFFAIHQLLSTHGELLFLQLHGNAETNCPAALLSDGSGIWSDLGPAGELAQSLANRGIDTGKCGAGYPTSSCNLCGLDNVEMRQTAESAEACTQMGWKYGRVIHLEQHTELRQTPGATSGYQSVIDAVLKAFPTSTL